MPCTGLGRYPRREGWLSCGPRKPRQLLRCVKRCYKLVHWFLGRSRKFLFCQLNYRAIANSHIAQGLGLLGPLIMLIRPLTLTSGYPAPFRVLGGAPSLFFLFLFLYYFLFLFFIFSALCPSVPPGRALLALPWLYHNFPPKILSILMSSGCAVPVWIPHVFLFQPCGAAGFSVVDSRHMLVTR